MATTLEILAEIHGLEKRIEQCKAQIVADESYIKQLQGDLGIVDLKVDEVLEITVKAIAKPVDAAAEVAQL